MQASRYFEPFLSTCYVLSKRFSMPITKVLTELKWMLRFITGPKKRIDGSTESHEMQVTHASFAQTR